MQRSFVDPPSKPRAGRNEGIKARRRDRCSNEAVVSSVKLVRSGAYAPALPSASIRAFVGWESRGSITRERRYHPSNVESAANPGDLPPAHCVQTSVCRRDP